jgi:hypothetical protein
MAPPIRYERVPPNVTLGPPNVMNSDLKALIYEVSPALNLRN